MRFGDFKLDIDDHSLWRVAGHGGLERVPLTARAFDVLRYLAANPNRAVSPGEIVSALWNGVHVQSSVVKGYILAIRTALGDASDAQRSIRTIRGRGYQFVAQVHSASALRGAPSEVFVGREREAAELQNRLERGTRRGTRLIFVSGEAGVGKSSLLHAFAVRAAALNPRLVVATGQCVEGFGGNEPYYVIFDALSGLARDHPTAFLRSAATRALAPHWFSLLGLGEAPRESPTMGPEEVGRRGTLHEGVRLVEAIALRQPLLLILEDLHWSDASTLDLLSAIARRASGLPLVIVASVRMSEARASRHPLTVLRADLLSGGLCHDVDLGPLTTNAVGEYLRHRIGDAAESDHLVSFVFKRSGGNPLLMTTVLEDLISKGAITQTDEGYSLTGSLSAIERHVPATLREMLEARLQWLTEVEKGVLEVGSLTELHFSGPVSSAAIGLSAEDFERAAEKLASNTDLIQPAGLATLPDGTIYRNYRFRHVLYRDALRTRQPPTQVARRHLQIAVRLIAVHGESTRGVSAELADHFTAGGDWGRAVTYLRAAADNALTLHAHVEAGNLLRRASELASKIDEADGPPIRLAVMRDLSAVYASCYDQRAYAEYAELAKLAESLGERSLLARALIELAFAQSWHSVDEGLVSLERAVEVSDHLTSSLERSRMRMSSHTWRMWLAGWNRTDHEAAFAAFADVERHCPFPKLAGHLVEYAMLLMMEARYGEAVIALEHAQNGIRTIEQNDRDVNICLIQQQVGLGLPWMKAFAGDVFGADELSDATSRRYRANGDLYEAKVIDLYRGWVRALVGSFVAALKLASPVVAPVTLAVAPRELYLLPAADRTSRIVRALALNGLGRVQEAFAELEAASAIMTSRTMSQDWYWLLGLRLARAKTLLSASRFPEADREAALLIRDAAAVREMTLEALGHDLAARIALERGDTQTADEHARRGAALDESRDLPLAAFRIAETAANIALRRGERALSREKEDARDAAVQRLLKGAPADHELAKALIAYSERI